MRKKSDMVGRVFIVVSLCLFAAGCGSRISMSNYEKIEAGMTEAEVEAILGKGEEQSSSSVDIPGQSIKVPGGGKFSFEGMSSSARAGQTQLVMAKMLIEMRNDDRSWEEIEDDPYMQYIKDEFAQWKNRIALKQEIATNRYAMANVGMERLRSIQAQRSCSGRDNLWKCSISTWRRQYCRTC